MYILKIKEFRKLKNVTQKQLAFKIGVSQNFLSEIEHQKYDIKLSLLFRIAGALEECPKDLIGCGCTKCNKEP
jgi:transcriptional regulator with XRE-family HTH domain